MEMSHRSKDYDEIHTTASSLVKELMGLSDEYKILWLQGGASSEFYMVPINLRIDDKPMEIHKVTTVGTFTGGATDLVQTNDIDINE